MQASNAGGEMGSPLLSDQDQKPVISLSREDDSDSDVRKVPEMVGFQSSSKAKATHASTSRATHHSSGGSRKRNAPAAEKEHKRLKRLLRNRVSAQQARERKKAYLSDLEARTKELEQQNAELEEKVSTLQQENAMLRKVIKNTAIRTNNSSSEK